MKGIYRLLTVFILQSILIMTIILPITSSAQDIMEKEKVIPDSIVSKIVNDFYSAVNSGHREKMEEFITSHYDQNILKRVPLFAAVSLYMGFYYETGGLGYEQPKILPSTAKSISIELYNKLTETTILSRIPMSNAPLFRINNFIKSEIAQKDNEKQIKKYKDDELIKKTELSLKKLAQDEEFSGTVIVAKEGKVLIEKAIGMASKSYEIPNKMDTKFNIASVGKTFTALAITQLVEQGKLSFDDSLSMYIGADWLDPEISKKIQIKHLLTHTSGLDDYFRDAYMQCDIPFFRELKDYKALIADDKLSFEPGTRFSYSNTGYILLGAVIEKITNDTYFNYLKKNIFEPAGMINTDGFDKDVPVLNRATGYTKVYTNVKVSWNNHQFTRIMRGSPSGGIYTSAEDLLRFDHAFRTNKFLTPEYNDILIKGRPELNVPFHSYGFFVSQGVVGRVLSHKGDGRGMNCHYKSFLDLGYTVIILSNYSAPSANIVANIIDQLITHMVKS